MHAISRLALAGFLVFTTADPSVAAEGALEATWSDTVGSNTLVTETICSNVSGPAPYNAKCTFTAVANNLPSASPQRGQCTEVLVTIGVRRFLGACRADFTVTMRVYRVRADRQDPAVFACNGTSTNQETDGLEPRPVKGTFTYQSSDGLVRQVPVDVSVVNNVVTFEGSVARVGTEDLLDDVSGRFPIRCRPSTGSGYTGEYRYVI